MKNTILIALLVICAGGLFYLNYLTEQQKDSAKQMRQSMEEAKARLSHQP
jgi:hypothetical protein